MEIQDIKGWTYGFMKRNESQCVKYIISLQEDALDAMRDKAYLKASALFLDVAYGLEKLSPLDNDDYELPLYSALFCAAEIEAFHLKNKEKAILLLEKASGIAKKCSAYDRVDSNIAEQDFVMMSDLLSKLQSVDDISQLKSDYEAEAWKLACDTAFSDIRMDNTISGIGCLALILAFVILFVLYSTIPPARG